MSINGNNNTYFELSNEAISLSREGFVIKLGHNKENLELYLQSLEKLYLNSPKSKEQLEKIKEQVNLLCVQSNNQLETEQWKNITASAERIVQFSDSLIQKGKIGPKEKHKDFKTTPNNLFRLLTLLEAIHLEGKEFYVVGEKIEALKHKVKFTIAEKNFLIGNQNKFEKFGYGYIINKLSDREQDTKKTEFDKFNNQEINHPKKRFYDFFHLYHSLDSNLFHPQGLYQLYTLCEGNTASDTIERAKRLLLSFPEIKNCELKLPTGQQWQASAWYPIILEQKEIALKFIPYAPSIEQALGESGSSQAPKNFDEVLIGWAATFKPSIKQLLSELPLVKQGHLLNFINLCVRNGIIDDDFNGNYRPRFSLALDCAESCLRDAQAEPKIPDLCVEGKDIDANYKDYYIKALRRDDPRGYIIGALSGCCQYVGNKEGQQSAIDSMENRNGGLYVLFKKKSSSSEFDYYKDEIIAQSYVHGDVNGDKNSLCFDSIESRDKTPKELKLIRLFFIELINRLYQIPSLKKITLGIGGNSAKMPKFFPKAKKKERIGGGYEFDSGAQRILCDRNHFIAPCLLEWKLQLAAYHDELLIPSKQQELLELLQKNHAEISTDALKYILTYSCENKLTDFVILILGSLIKRNNGNLLTDSELFATCRHYTDLTTEESFKFCLSYFDIDFLYPSLKKKGISKEVGFLFVDYLDFVKSAGFRLELINSIFNEALSNQNADVLEKIIRNYPKEVKENNDPKEVNRSLQYAVSINHKGLMQAILSLDTTSSVLKSLFTPYLSRQVVHQARILLEQ